jgi:hypothetical protein
MMSDADIDRIGRQMTEREPAPDFRARVMAALPASRRPWSWPRLVPAAAVVATAATAVVVLGPRAIQPAVNLPEVPRMAMGRPLPAPPAAVPEARPMTGASVPARPRRIEESAASVAWRARTLPPLPAILPVALDAIQPEALTITPITVDRLSADPIVVPPIDRN